MLVAEKQMTEGNGILLSNPVDALGYQCAGAFQRLGRRMIGLLKNNTELGRLKHIPMQTMIYDWELDLGEWKFSKDDFSAFLATPFPNLSLNTSLTDEACEKLSRLIALVQSTNAKTHIILVLPESSSLEQIKKLQGPSTTIFLSPAVYSFRDQGLMDSSLKALAEKPESLLKTPTHREEFSLVFAGDLAGFLISAPGNDKLYGEIIEVPAQKISLGEWQKHFSEAFRAEVDVLNKIKSTFSSSWRFPKLQTARTTISSTSALNIFPTPVTPVDRALKQSARHHLKNPELELIFPPGRAP